jgi:DNA-binding transcriptional LysR family regulator
MQLRFIEYFAAIARERHFGRAAVACHVSQPTLSAGLLALEESLGHRLVIRDRRFVDLTVEGYAILPFAQQLIGDLVGIRTALAIGSRPLRGLIRLGCIPAAMPIVGHLVRAVQAAHPALRINIGSMTSREIERSLLAHDLDGGLTYLLDEPPAQTRSVTLYAERFVVVVRKGARLAAKARLNLAELSEEPLCLLHQGMQNRRILDGHLARLGVTIDPVATADSYVALLSMVANGGLSAIITDSHAELFAAHPELVVIPIGDVLPTNVIGLVVLDREPMSPLATVLLALANGLQRVVPDAS